MIRLYYRRMGALMMIHARLDEETRGLLARLRRNTGWNVSEIVRRGIQALARQDAPVKGELFVGLGCFESGVPDLGSDKKHLSGFGRK